MSIEPTLFDSSIEEPLPGGRLTKGVVRIGSTVRRPHKPSTDFVSSLLRLLEARGFTGAPRYLGQDDLQREVLTYIPGSDPAQLRQFTNSQISRAGSLLRTFHDVTRGTELAGTKSVICHNDAGPYNTIFQNEVPTAFIDFDLAAPGEPIEDLGYMGWLWCVSSKLHDRPLHIQAVQLGMLLDGYELDSDQRLLIVDAMLERQEWNVRFWQDRLESFDGPEVSISEIQSRIDWSKRERIHTELHRQIFLDAITQQQKSKAPKSSRQGCGGA